MDWFGHSRYFLLGEGIRLHAFKKISIVIRFVTLRDTNRSIMNNERGLCGKHVFTQATTS